MGGLLLLGRLLLLGAMLNLHVVNHLDRGASLM